MYRNIQKNIQKYTGICFQSASRMQFLDVKKWSSTNIFSDTKQKYVCKLFSKSSELTYVKWVRCFEQNCIVKSVIFIDSYFWQWDFLLENLQSKNTLIMSTGTCRWIFSFLGAALGSFSQFLLLLLLLLLLSFFALGQPFFTHKKAIEKFPTALKCQRFIETRRTSISFPWFMFFTFSLAMSSWKQT